MNESKNPQYRLLISLQKWDNARGWKPATSTDGHNLLVTAGTEKDCAEVLEYIQKALRGEPIQNDPRKS